MALADTDMKPFGSGKLILPGHVKRNGLTILVPRGYEDKPRVVGKCHVCGAEFFKGQEERWQRHVGACARSRLDELVAGSPRLKHNGIFDEQSWDPEVYRHLKRVGDRMLAEGRLEMRPNERAEG